MQLRTSSRGRYDGVMSLDGGSSGPENQSDGVPQGTLIGTTAQGTELRSFQPYRLSGMSGEQLLGALSESRRVRPVEDAVAQFVRGYPASTASGLMGTCIPTIYELGHRSSPSTKDLNDPSIVDSWNKHLNGYKFTRLPQIAVLELLLDPQFRIQIDKYSQGPQPRRDGTMTWLDGRSISAMPEERRSFCLKVSDIEDKFRIGLGPANPELLWRTSTRVLLGVQPE